MGRVSTKGQKVGGSSDEAQGDRIYGYADEERLKMVKFWDVAETASKHDRRTHFREMLAFVKASQDTATPH